MSRSNSPAIGAHLAVLNLFREPDGSLQITVAAADGAMSEWSNGFANKAMNLPPDAKPIDYVEELIVEAAENMKGRRNG